MIPMPSALPQLLPQPLGEMLVVALPPAEASDRVQRTCEVLSELEEEAMIGRRGTKMAPGRQEEAMFEARSGGGGGGGETEVFYLFLFL